MRKWLVHLVFLVIGGQSLFYFALGREVQIFLFGRYWQPLHLVLFFVFWLWFVSYPLESRFSRRPPPPLPVLFKVLYVLSGILLLVGVLRGVAAGRYAALSQAEMTFWPFFLIPVGWSLHVDRGEWKKLMRLLIWPALLLAALSVPFLVGRRFLELEAPGYLSYSEQFLVAMAFIYYYVRVVSLKSHGRGDRLALALTTLSIGLAFNKAVMLPLVSAVVFLFLVQYRKRQRENAGFLGRLVSFILPVVWVLILILLLGQLTPSVSVVSDYYRAQWEHRFLHVETGDISGGRFRIWERAWFYIRREPWLGYGMGIQLLRERDLFTLSAQEGIGLHNQYILLLMSLGIPGGGLVIGGLLSLVGYAARARNQGVSDDETHVSLSLLGFVWMMLTYGLVSFWGTAPAGYTLLGLSMGIVLRLACQASSTAERASPLIGGEVVLGVRQESAP